MIETTELQYVECDIEQLTKQRDNHQMEVDDLNRALADLRKQRRDLVMAAHDLKRGDKLLVTEEAFTCLGGNAYTFAVGDIWIVNSMSENKVITITENDGSRSPYRRSEVELVKRMKTAYLESVKV